MSLPLLGVRVIEMGQLLAVPYLCKLLADMGAEIIRFESCTRLDPHRNSVFYGNAPGPTFWNRGANFYDQNRNKLGITIDLSDAEGRDLFRSLIAVSDVFCENFTPRVMHNFLMEYEDLAKIRPDIIMLSSTGYGYHGPWANYGAVGPTVEASSGLMHISSYQEAPPVLAEIPYTDFVGAEHGLVAVMAALHYRAKTGIGQFIDLSQQASQAALVPEVIMDYLANGRDAASGGSNDHPSMAPHGVFPCRAESDPAKEGEIDRWIAIAVQTDKEWDALIQVMNEPQWSRDPRFHNGLARWHNRGELNHLIGEWTIHQDAIPLMQRLQDAGVAAGVPLTNRDLLWDRHLRGREFFRLIEHPKSSGIPPLPYPGLPWKLSDSSPLPSRAAATLGEHNTYVFAEMLGYSENHIKDLESQGVIGWNPVDARVPKPVERSTLLEQRRIATYDEDFEARIADELRSFH